MQQAATWCEPGSRRHAYEDVHGDRCSADPAVDSRAELIVHRVGDRDSDIRGSRFAADQIPGATYVELPAMITFLGSEIAKRRRRDPTVPDWDLGARRMGGTRTGTCPLDCPLHGHCRLK